MQQRYKLTSEDVNFIVKDQYYNLSQEALDEVVDNTFFQLEVASVMMNKKIDPSDTDVNLYLESLCRGGN
jgi:hypothetical protein